jgi:hypothetical protein
VSNFIYKYYLQLHNFLIRAALFSFRVTQNVFKHTLNKPWLLLKRLLNIRVLFFLLFFLLCVFLIFVHHGRFSFKITEFTSSKTRLPYFTTATRKIIIFAVPYFNLEKNKKHTVSLNPIKQINVYMLILPSTF